MVGDYTYWCDECKEFFTYNTLSEEGSCSCGNQVNNHTHMVTIEKNGKRTISVDEDDYRNVLPSKLWYFYVQAKASNMTFSHRKMAIYHIDENKLEINGKLYGTK